MKIKLFAGAAAAVGRTAIDLSAPTPASIAEVRDKLLREYPELEPLLTVSRWAVNQEFVDESHLIFEFDEVALIPPVSGG